MSKIDEEKIIKKNIIDIFDNSYSPYSIRKMTLTLRKRGIKRSPQVVKRLLLELVEEGKIEKD